MKPKVIIILGPTAVGKTKLSIDLAKKLNTEIVSADSMQIYKYMDIGTAKPTEEEMSGIKHYMIDEIDPVIEFSVAQYKELAQNYLDEIISQGKTPIVVGGTGLYINSLIYNIQFSESINDPEYRAQLLNLAASKGNEYLHSLLAEVDPESTQRLHSNDVKRIIRALEVYRVTGKTMTYHYSVSRLNPSKYDFILVGLSMDREVLYKRINKRVDIMLDQGLVEEVKALLEKGYTKNLTSMQGIGYKEIINYLEGNCSLDEAIETIKQESRRYAKRQFTWFRRIEEIKWFDVTGIDYEKFFKKVYEYIAQNLEIM